MLLDAVLVSVGQAGVVLCITSVYGSLPPEYWDGLGWMGNEELEVEEVSSWGSTDQIKGKDNKTKTETKTSWRISRPAQ